MMTEHDALLRSILDNPDDDTVRLVYADHLQENGEEERAEFIRVQCRTAQPGLMCIQATGNDAEDESTKACGSCMVCSLWRREQELLAENAERWFPAWQAMTSEWGDVCGRSVCRRGFIETPVCTAADWLAHAGAICVAHPVRRVTLTTWPGHEYIQNDGVRTWSVPKEWCRACYSTGVIVEMCDRRAEITLGCREKWPRIEFALPAVAAPDPAPGYL